jgi:hypothetical protein
MSSYGTSTGRVVSFGLHEAEAVRYGHARRRMRQQVQGNTGPSRQVVGTQAEPGATTEVGRQQVSLGGEIAGRRSVTWTSSLRLETPHAFG